MRNGFVGGICDAADAARSAKVGFWITCHKVAPDGATFF